MVIGLTVLAVWIGLLVLVVALCQASARADKARDRRPISAYSNPSTVRDVPAALAPTRSVPRRVGKPAGGRSVSRLPG
jgi:hypothetical protein